MAVITSLADGLWSASGTWVGYVVPNSGDTVTIAHNINVSDNQYVGNDVAVTGLTFSTEVAGKVLRILNSGVLSILGGATITSSFQGTNSIQVDGGGTFQFQPAAGVNNVMTFAQNCSLIASGSPTNRPIVRTDKSRGGLNSSMAVTTFRVQGLVTAVNADFYDWGTASANGLLTSSDNHIYSIPVYIANCTFTRCNYQQLSQSIDYIVGNITFQNNVFASSTFATLNGADGASAAFQASVAPTGTILIDSNYFDGSIGNQKCINVKFTNNVIAHTGITAPITFGINSSWDNDTYFNNNVITGRFVSPNSINFGGNISNCYFVVVDSGVNLRVMQFANTANSNYSLSRCVFEYPFSTLGGGDLVLPQNPGVGINTLTAKYNLVLPDASGNSAGVFIDNLSSSGSAVAIICEHNTYCGDGTNGVMIYLDKTVSSYSGAVLSCQSNLIWSPVSSGSYAIKDIGAGTPAVDAVTYAGYNAFQNPNSGLCYWNVNTAQAVWGYLGVKTSVNHNYPNSAVGSIGLGGTDVDITAVGPRFVDSTRNIEKWGITQGANGTLMGALSVLANNRGLINQAGIGLIPWVRSGFVPQNIVLQSGSYPGDTSTIDANGTAWPGGIPGIGAMAYSSSGIFINRVIQYIACGQFTSLGLSYFSTSKV